jgi:hypothetical protein
MEGAISGAKTRTTAAATTRMKAQAMRPLATMGLPV